MRYVPLGRSGLNISAVVPSTANVVRAERHGDDLLEIVWGIQEAVHTHGFNCFETADTYAFGGAEAILGRALEGIREQVAVIGALGATPDREGGWHAFHSLQGLTEALDQTLRRMQTGYLDVCIVRGVDPAVDAAQLAASMEAIRAVGSVRWWGVADRPLADLEVLASAPGFTAWAAPLSLLERELAGHAAACSASGATLLALRPLGMGLLAGEYRSRPDFRLNPDRAWFPYFAEKGYADAQHGIAYLRRLAWARGVNPSVVALAWAAHVGAVPVVNWRDAGQLVELVQATDLRLTEHELARLTEAFAIPG